MRPYGLGLHALSWQLLVTALVSSSDALVSVNRTHTGGLQNHSKATSTQFSKTQEAHASSLQFPRLVSRSKATHSVPVTATLAVEAARAARLARSTTSPEAALPSFLVDGRLLGSSWRAEVPNGSQPSPARC